MTRSLSAMRWCRVDLVTLLLALVTFSASGASPQRVLILLREPSQALANVMIEQAARDKLLDLGGDDLQISVEHLYPEGTRDYLRAQYRDWRPDLILRTAMLASELAPGELFPGVPTVFIWMNPDPFPGAPPGTNITGVVAVVDFRGTLDLIFKLQPDTRRIVVIGGVSPGDRRRLARVEQTSQAFSNRAAFEFWTNQPMSELQTAVSRLPADTVVLYAWMFRDISGHPFAPVQALEMLLATASVPVYVFVDSHLGSGAVGGAVVRYDELGARAGEIALRILRGANAADIPITEVTNGTPTVDRRALRRWGISESRLPPGSIVEQRQRTFWEQYRWRIVGVLAFCALQTALLVGLVLNRTKRRQGEAEAILIADISSKFVNLPVGEVDREVMDAQRRLCELLGLDFSALWQWSDEAAGFRLTHFYTVQAGPQSPERMSEDQYPWARQELLAGRVIKIDSLKNMPAEAARDRETLHQLGIKSNLAVPLSVGGGPPVGLLGLGTMRAERAWPDALVKRLQLAAQIFANAFARKRADHALRESEELNRATFEQAAVGIAHVGVDGRWLRVNDKLCAIVGYPREELLELTFQDITPPGDLEQDRKLLRQFLSGELKAGSLEKRYVRKDGVTIWVVISVSLVRTASGTPLHFIAVVEDVTERKNAETELLQQRAELARAGRVTLLGQLASALAHELNQPLGAILRNAEAAEIMLQGGSPDLEELRAIVTDILRDDQRAGQVIARLRSLLKGRNLVTQPIELPGVISEVFSLVRADAAARHVTLESSAAPNLPKVQGDRIHLQQVLLNLLVNAMDATDACAPDRRSIQVSARLTDPTTIEIRVADHGPGVPPDALARLFEPFFTTKAKGMGMGLPVSKTIIEAHRGRLWVENRPEGGACFCFTLPVSEGNK